MFSGSRFLIKVLLRTCLMGMLLVAPMYANAGNNNYSYIKTNIFDTSGNGAGKACSDCHSPSAVGATGVNCDMSYYNWDAYTVASGGLGAAQDAANIVARTATGSAARMPYADCSTYTSTTNPIYPSYQTILSNWYNAGTPYADATATTNAISGQQKTQVTFNATVNTNTTNPNVVAGKDGQWYFEWGTGTGSTYTSGAFSTTTRNSISSGAVSATLTGLACGNSYHYRVVAKNGDSTTNGSQVNFSTSSCTSPSLSQQVAGTYATNEDTATDMVLLVTDPDAGTLTWSISSNGSKGVASITGGTTTSAPVTSGSKTIHYVPNSNQNGPDSVTILVTSNKGNNKTGSITLNISITAVNDPPVVSAVGSTSFQEGDAAKAVNSSLTVTEVDSGASGQIKGATVTITNYASADGEVLACTGSPTGISTCTFSAGTLTLAGTTTTANYQTALRGVTYYNPSANPTVGDRTVQFVVQDNSGAGNDTSAGSNTTVSVSSVSTPPTITGFSGTTAFTEQTPVIVDSSVGITDPDSPVGSELNRAQMVLALTNYNAADSLVCPSSGLPSGISCSYDTPSRTLTLSSASSNSLADYQTAIALVQFNNTSDAPSTGDRTVTLTARDSSNTVSSIYSKTISITPVNDPPVINSIVSNTPIIEEQAGTVDITVTVSDPDDGSFTYSLSGALAGATASGVMKIDSNTGVITWTPPRTGIFNKATATVTLKVEDKNASGASNGVLSTTQTFNLATSPPDTDKDPVTGNPDPDGVPDYSDNCPTVYNPPSVVNGPQADMDNDTVHGAVDPSGIPADGDVVAGATDTNGFVTGGNACDDDIDGDGMPNSYENLYPFLNPMDPTDAAKDYDGDGVSNLAEYIAGTPPDLDSVGPVVIAPAAVTVNSTGYLTDVDLGFASAIDGNDGSISSIVPIIDATIDPTSYLNPKDACLDLLNYPLTAPPFRPGSYKVNWSTCDKSRNISYATQDVRVRPILSTTPGQTVGAGQTAVVRFMLNGQAADYPVTAKYTVSGTANSSDYSLGSSTLTISQTDVEGTNPGLVGKLSITTAGSISQDENVTITLSNVSNAVLGATKTHTISIVNHDTTPVLSTAVTQNGVATGRTVYANTDPVILTVNTSDTNTATAPAFDWSMTDNAIFGIGSVVDATGSSSMSFDPSGLTAGLYPVVVTVTDAGLTSTARFTLSVAAIAPDLADCNLDGAADSNTDCDGDGTDNATEGAVDSNGNGIPDYLDDNRIVDRNVLQNETGDPINTYLLMTDPGLQLRLGATALASGASGALVSQQNINNHGGPNGGAGVNPQDSDSNDGGFYDFEVTGLNNMITSARVVIPLQSAILDNAVYRKYNGTAWSSFVVDANNTISSAAGNNGVCPAPGSIEYTPGLTPLNTCVELLIEDGGPNDVDGVRDYVIRDPGGVGIPLAEATPAPDKAKGGAGALHPAWLLLVLAVFSLFAPRRWGQR